MQTSPPLARAFLSHLSTGLNIPEDPRELEDLLRGAFAKAEAEWPTVRLSPEAFSRHLGRHVPRQRAGEPLEDVLAELSLGELYLACACALGDECAILELDRQYLSVLPRMLGKLNQAADVLDDISQTLRETMLVRKGTQEPRIGEFAGRGALLNWLKVAATRAALKVMRQGRFAAEDDDLSAAMKALPAPGVDAEMDLLKRRHRQHYLEGIRLAFAELTDEERHQLRLRYVDGLSTPRMADVLGNNQATVWRHLEKVQRKIHDLAKHHVKQNLKLSTAEFESLMEDVRSQLDVSLSRMLEERKPPAPVR